MIDKTTFHPLNYIKKEEYSGSMDGMRYMLKNIGDGKMSVTIWPEPLGIYATSEDKKTVEVFPLDEDGVNDAADWLNKMYFDNQDMWTAALEKGLL